VADVLFGDYNPSGKLTITFPKTVGQIPYNFPYKRASQVRTENLNAQEKKTMVNGPLYPFGHGLSYTTFHYSSLSITPALQKPDGPIQVSLDLENTGSRAGDEIVQLYVSDEVTSVIYYESVLRGFERVSLKPGEKTHVRFTLAPQDLMLLTREMKWVVEPGRVPGDGGRLLRRYPRARVFRDSLRVRTNWLGIVDIPLLTEACCPSSRSLSPGSGAGTQQARLGAEGRDVNRPLAVVRCVMDLAN